MSESSLAQPERYSLYSPSNRRRLPVWWSVPPGTGPFPLLVLLHGVYDADGSGWWRQGRAHEAAAKAPRPCVVVMPSDTGAELGSGWCDWSDGTAAAETHLMEEVLPWAQAELPLTNEAWLTGLSMGGYGAVTLALRHPGRFTSVSSTSGFLNPARLFDFVPEAAQRMWGDDAASHDPRALLTKAGATPPPLTLDCGQDDALLSEHRDACTLLRRLGVNFTSAEHPGGHDWDYWRARLPEHLSFHASAARP